jgi:hypothetical protein
MIGREEQARKSCRAIGFHNCAVYLLLGYPSGTEINDKPIGSVTY